jgi:hypothetical protein
VFFLHFFVSSYFSGTDGLYVKHTTIHDLGENSLEDYKKRKWRCGERVLNIAKRGFKHCKKRGFKLS